MATALNLTAPLKQDPDSLARLHELVETFAERVQPALQAALDESEVVHFARVLVIDDTYLQVLTEFDGDPMAYTEFFRTQLGPVFQQIFSLVEGAPPWEELDDPDAFFEYTSGLSIAALGTSADGEEYRGYLFSAVGDATVREIKASLQPAPAAV
jgi:hypothetical protein